MGYLRRPFWVLVVLIAVCISSLADADLSGAARKSSISFRSSVRSFNFAALFAPQKGYDLKATSRSVRKTRKRRRRRRVKKNMQKRLVSRNKRLVRRSSKHQRHNRRRVTKRWRPKKMTKRIIKKRRLRWRRIPQNEIKRMTVYGKRLINHGRSLIRKGKIRTGTSLINKGKKAVYQLKKLEKGYRLVAGGKRLLKAGKRAKGKRLIKMGIKIQKSLGSTSKIRLPGYETMNASRKPKAKKKKNPHGRLPNKKDMKLLRSKYHYGTKLLNRARKLIRQGKAKKGRKLMGQAKQAIKKLKELDRGYRLIFHGKKLIKAGQTRRGNQLMRRGFNIKMSMGSGQYIRIPGFQTMNASRRPSQTNKNVSKKVPNRHRRGPKGRKNRQTLKSKSKKGGKRARGKRHSSGKGKRPRRRGSKMGSKRVRGKRHGKGKGKRRHRRGGPKKNLRTTTEKKNLHRSIPKKKDISLLRNKYKYGKKLLRHARKLIQRGNPNKGRKLMQQAKKAIKDLKELDRGYRLIFHGKKLIKAGQTKKGNELMRRGFNIKMSFGSGQYIRLPGFQTMNASRRPSKGNKKNVLPGRKGGNRKGGNRKKPFSPSVKKKIMRRKLARNPHKGLSNCKKMKQFARELLRRSNALKKQGKAKRSRKLYQATVKALRKIKKLENGYKMIARGEKLLKNGKAREGKRLVRRGFKITMSLGAGAFIRLPGFQTMNANRFAPTSPSTPSIPSIPAPPVAPTSPKKLHLEYTTTYPKTCACKLGSGFNNGVCYHMTDENTDAKIRQCKKEACKASYVCVVGMSTNITCIRKKNTHRTVPLGDGKCRKEAYESISYVVYAS